MWVLRLTQAEKAVARRWSLLLPASMPALGSVCLALPPSVRHLHGFRAPAGGFHPWLWQSLFPAGLRGSAPCPSSFRRPAPRHVGCQSAPAGPAVTAACAWREAPGWPGSAARALRGLRLLKETLQLVELQASALLLSVMQMTGRWMCPEGSAQERLLMQQLALLPVRPELGPSHEPGMVLLL